MCIAFSACLLSCEVDTLPETEMINTLTGKKAKYEELSAGTATIFNNSKTAYDTNAPWVTGELYNRFLQGDLLYDDRRIPDMDGFEQGGLGPVYAGFSCGSCHNNTGRTASTLWTEGGSGSAGFSSCLIYLTRKDGGFLKNYGRVLHDQSSIIGVKPEGKLKVTYTYQTYRFPDALLDPRKIPYIRSRCRAGIIADPVQMAFQFRHHVLRVIRLFIYLLFISCHLRFLAFPVVFPLGLCVYYRRCP